jgi:hypothetical protein
MPDRYRPTHKEGLNIQYKLKVSREGFVSIGKRLGLTKQAVCDVVYGRRRSARIESEIARILGKADWNEVVLEARSEVQKKPVEVILDEMRQARKNRRQACIERMGKNREERLEEADKFVREGLAAIEQRKLGRAAGRRVTT